MMAAVRLSEAYDLLAQVWTPAQCAACCCWPTADGSQRLGNMCASGITSP